MGDSIWNGVEIQENGSISPSDARAVRARLRVFITADVRRLGAIVSEIESLQSRLADMATMEIAIEDFEDPEKEP